MAIYGISGEALQAVYGLEGTQLSNCYDLTGAGLMFTLVTNTDSSTGTSTGYSLTSEETENQYVLRQVINFRDVATGNSLQSFVYNYDNQTYYKFDASTTVYVFDSSLVLTGSVTLPSSAGHNNDGCYHNGKIYFPSGYFGASETDGTKLFVWDISQNTVTAVAVDGITQPQNGSIRIIAGVCETARNSGKLYLVCQDCTSSELVHDEGDKLAVYEYDIASGTCKLKAEFPWDCVYVQGATVNAGILYVACNTQTTGTASNYKGITIKCIRTDTWAHFDTLTVGGTFEPEGMDVFPADGGQEIAVGMGHWGTMQQTARFTPPYELVAAESGAKK